MKEDSLLAPYVHAERVVFSVSSYAENQSLNHWDGTSRQTSTWLSPLHVVFPLPQ